MFWLQMSLYIGNLSSHTCRGELERVFQRFGYCNVRVKDGYGFVVYESAPNAEKALITLQGRDICGQPLTLMWSNKQPRPYKRFSKAARSYEPLYGRSSNRREDYTDRRLHSNSRKYYKFGRRVNSADMLDGDTSYHQDNIKDYIQEEHCEYREDLPDEGVNDKPKPVDNDRWAGQLQDQPNGNSIENGMELDRYECYRGSDRRDEHKIHHIAYSDGSHVQQSSQDVLTRGHLSEAPLDPSNHSKPQLTCYSCGGSGHKMRNCPRQITSQRKFKRLGHRHDDDIKRSCRAESNLERYEAGSQREQRPYRDSISVSGLGDEGKASGSGRHQRLIKNRSSSEAKEGVRARKDHEAKKRRRNFGSPNKHSEKKAKRSVSLSLHSDYAESGSHSTSRSPKPVPKFGLRSRSRLASSRSYSFTSNSRSSSTPHYSRSTSSKSRSRSDSHKSLPLSESLGEPLPSSPNKEQSNLKGTSAKTVIPESKEILVEQALPCDVSETAELENNTLVAKSDKVVSSSEVENDMDKNQHMQRDWNDNLMISTSLLDIANHSTHPSEKDTLNARSLSSETLKETMEHQNSDVSEIVHKPSSIKNSNSEAPVSLHSACSTSISSDEMYMVLKHYGLELDENERNLPPQAYFGSARLWPWEIIYYRRLKKGPISIENYARRVAQNQEFGIVDKYVRSSSGWGELGQD
ncbi:hypothetical protein WN944_004768 [Citrus x changshan-huyou]